jgi:nitroreductase
VETWDAIRSRRDVREFEDRPIPREHLEQILEAARRTPSAGNRQHWDFVMVTDRGKLERLSRVWRGAAHVARAGAAVALVAPPPEDERGRDLIQYDLGQATMSIMLAAADLGIASRHASVSDRDLAAELLGLPSDRFAAYLISLGYPADRPLKPIKTPDRRPFDDVVHWGGW